MNHTTDTVQATNGGRDAQQLPLGLRRFQTGEPTSSNAKVYPRVRALAVTNPRQWRAPCALLFGPASRKQLDRITAASNSPNVIRRLRCKGFEIPCSHTEWVADTAARHQASKESFRVIQAQQRAEFAERMKATRAAKRAAREALAGAGAHPKKTLVSAAADEVAA